MKKTTRKLLSLAMASAMAASLLTGCGGGGANETTAAAGTEKTEAGKTETEAGSTEAAAEGTAGRGAFADAGRNGGAVRLAAGAADARGDARRRVQHT